MSKRHDDFNENFSIFFLKMRKKLKTCRNLNLRDFRVLSLGDYIIYVTFIS